MLSSASLTTLTGNYEDILLLTAIYFHYFLNQLQQSLISPMFVSSVTIIPIGVSTSDVSTSLELCSYWQYKKPRRSSYYLFIIEVPVSMTHPVISKQLWRRLLQV